MTLNGMDLGRKDLFGRKKSYEEAPAPARPQKTMLPTYSSPAENWSKEGGKKTERRRKAAATFRVCWRRVTCEISIAGG